MLSVIMGKKDSDFLITCVGKPRRTTGLFLLRHLLHNQVDWEREGRGKIRRDSYPTGKNLLFRWGHLEYCCLRWNNRVTETMGQMFPKAGQRVSGPPQGWSKDAIRQEFQEGGLNKHAAWSGIAGCPEEIRSGVRENIHPSTPLYT